MGLPADQSSLLRDILSAINDDELTDVILKGNDGHNGGSSSKPVHANRFILAARSKVFRRMLYGSFVEATSTVIQLNDYDSVTLQAIVEYCTTNEITSTFRLHHEMLHRNCISARRLAQLYKAADYFELVGLMDIVSSMVSSLMNTYPPLSCGIFDEATPTSSIYNDALCMIQCRPYVTLQPHDDKGGGIECLSPEKLFCILQDKDIQAGEYFLFTMLQQWVEFQNKIKHGEDGENEEGDDDNNTDNNTINIHEIAKSCGQKLILEYIEPQDLLGPVKKSKFCSDSQITQAITLQALRASQNGIWSLSCRGGGGSSGRQDTIDRILVEGAGSVDVNGIYYKIDGLANGELYSKREVACGQQHVYTLSCTHNNSSGGGDQQVVECRIFSSKLLTHQAIRNLSTHRHVGSSPSSPSSSSDPNYQPLLQIFHIIDQQTDECQKMNDDKDNKQNSSYDVVNRQVVTNSDVATIVTRNQRPRNTKDCGAVQTKCQQKILLSDGDHYMAATMSQELSLSIRSRELKKNSLIKVLEYETYILDGKSALQLQKICLISQDPGNRFGNPIDFHDAYELEEEVDNTQFGRNNDPVVVSATAAPIETRFCRELMMQRGGQNTSNSDSNGLLFPNGSDKSLCELYSSRYLLSDAPADSKIPRTGWQIDSGGIAPGPKCRWIQALPTPTPSPTTVANSDSISKVKDPASVLVGGN